MRMWRVGTVTMGASLLLLGIFLLITSLTGAELSPVLVAWWPAVLMILGAEILVFLFFHRKENGLVRYDVFSILIVGFLGTVGAGMAVFSSSGIATEIAAAVRSQEKVLDLPEFQAAVGSDVRRIIVESSRDGLTFEGTDNREVSVFGTYRTMISSPDDQPVKTVEDYVSMHQTGDTLYITVKDLPQRSGWLPADAWMSATMMIPAEVNLEIRGKGEDVVLRPRFLQADWSVEQGGNISVYIQPGDDVELIATNAQFLDSDVPDSDWQVAPAEEAMAEWEAEEQNGRLLIGEGSNQIRLMNCYDVSVYRANEE
ncbi:hypothetical protein SAMN05421736_101948 [Evansella caseinilytica]|uniref:DUF5668 domain-containing protein n=1 Tax=Evansella caseinilytica TaxID=1503961 RepID=A0A1H3IWD9_9BACI|nr:hypothetical protein [Evansella caseinilytica]SDY32030.1 hypothetical protein SAMN05421736_101948 [Evansella caseinilytica]